MYEESFENFDMIEKTVLELIAGGFNSYSQVAKLLGVPETFAENIFGILLGYGHIDLKNQITELGRTSLESDKKITEFLTKQIISIDALNGCPVNIDKSLADSEMVDISGHHKDDIIIPSANETETETFLKQLNNDLKTISEQQQISINVKRIENSVYLRTEYASAFLMHFTDIKTPVVFAKIYDPSKKEFSERFSWQPLSITSEHAEFFTDFASYRQQLPDVTKSLKAIYDYITEKSESEKSKENSKRVLLEKLQSDFDIDTNFTTVSDDYLYCTLSLKAFKTFNESSLNLLLAFGRYGLSLFTNIQINGRIITLIPDKTLSLSMLKEFERRTANKGFKEILKLCTQNTDETKDIISNIEALLPKL